MNTFFRWTVVFILLMIMGGCHHPEEVKKIRIFDFQQFFTQQAAILKANHTGLIKNITDKENVFTNSEKAPDWEKELAVFKSFSLIKQQQESLYDVDTLKSEREFVFITYSANTNQPKLQLAEVMYNTEHQIEKITLVVKTDEVLNNSDITLTYLPLKGYDIKGDINSKIAGKSFLDVHVECVD